MRITEQIDALEVMAIHPIKYLVVPILLASLISFSSPEQHLYCGRYLWWLPRWCQALGGECWQLFFSDGQCSDVA